MALWPRSNNPTRLPTTELEQTWKKVLIRCGRGVHLPFHPPPHIRKRDVSAETMRLKYHMTVMLGNACSKHDASLLSVHLHSSVPLTLIPTNALDVYVYYLMHGSVGIHVCCSSGKVRTLATSQSSHVHFIRCLPDYILPWGMLPPLARSKHDYTRTD